MGTISWFIVGVVVGLFIPGPYNTRVKNYITDIWNKLTNKTNTKSTCC